MGVQHELRVKDEIGIMKYRIDNFDSLSYVREVNEVDTLTFVIPGTHEAVRNIGDMWQVEYWRRFPEFGIDWYREFSGFFREPDQDDVDPGVFTGICKGDSLLLERRHVAWYADTLNRSKFLNVAGETIMKTLVDYNAGPNATSANGRLRDGTISGLNIEADGGGGNAVSWYCAYSNLLATLQKLSVIAGGDFDLVKTGDASWEFRWFDGQLGADRTATVKFSVPLGNLINPRFRVQREQERTVAIVAGRGERADRDIVIRTGTNHSSANDVEIFIDANDVDKGDLNALAQRGDQRLAEIEELTAFTFDIQQSRDATYGKHYFLGDLVSIVNPFTGATLQRKIVQVTGSIDSRGNENIGVTIGNV